MATAFDVAAFVQSRTGGVDRIKLQKLTYYAQVWTLVWDGRRLYRERIEAWEHGPVVPDLWRADAHGRGLPGTSRGSVEALSDHEAANVDAVIDFYNGFTGWELRERTHEETPYIDAWGDRKPGDKGDEEIMPAAILRYYLRARAEGRQGPTRATDEPDVTDDVFDAVVSEQLDQWREVLDRMDPR